MTLKTRVGLYTEMVDCSLGLGMKATEMYLWGHMKMLVNAGHLSSSMGEG